MDIKVHQSQQITQTEASKPVEQPSEAFKFALMSNIEEADLKERLTGMMNEITMQGERIKKKKDIGDMRKYRSLIKRILRIRVIMNHLDYLSLLPTIRLSQPLSEGVMI